MEEMGDNYRPVHSAVGIDLVGSGVMIWGGLILAGVALFNIWVGWAANNRLSSANYFIAGGCSALAVMFALGIVP